MTEISFWQFSNFLDHVDRYKLQGRSKCYIFSILQKLPLNISLQYNLLVWTISDCLYWWRSKVKCRKKCLSIDNFLQIFSFLTEKFLLYLYHDSIGMENLLPLYLSSLTAVWDLGIWEFFRRPVNKYEFYSSIYYVYHFLTFVHVVYTLILYNIKKCTQHIPQAPMEFSDYLFILYI